MTTENIGEIVIAPRVLEVITGIAATKVEGVYALQNKNVTDSLSKTSLGRGVYLRTEEDGTVNADIYVSLQYGVNVPAVSIEIQKAVKAAVYDMAEVAISEVNVHVESIVTEKSQKPDLAELFNEDSRRDLRERAFQTLFALEFGGEALEQAHFAYTYDKPIDEETEVDVPAFLLSLVTGVREELAQLDSQIEEKLKEGWSLSRLIVTDRTLLRLGLYEITSFEETPGRVAINEIIEIAKKYSDETSAKFINGVLSQFVTDEA